MYPVIFICYKSIYSQLTTILDLSCYELIDMTRTRHSIVIANNNCNNNNFTEMQVWSVYSLKAKAESCPITSHEGAWWERRYISYLFSASALDGGEWSASLPGRALAPGRGPPVPIVQEAGWTPESVWTQRLEEKSLRLCRGSNVDRWVAQLVARHYTD
jgi:hypothetical protein